jgi:putative membrane protein
MSVRSLLAVPFVTAVALVSLAAPAQGASHASSVDRAFVAAASESNAAEIAFAKEAVENGNVATALYARTMIRDHTKLQAALARAARSAKLTVHTTPSVSQAKMIAKVVKLDGTAFDSAYRAKQVTAHLATVLAFQKELAHGTDSVLKAAAKQALPTIRMHLAMARKLAASRQAG